MTLLELSKQYESSAVLLRARLKDLRARARQEQDTEKRFRLKRRIAALTVMLTQTNELRDLLEHYYERGYYRNEKYRI